MKFDVQMLRYSRKQKVISSWKFNILDEYNKMNKPAAND